MSSLPRRAGRRHDVRVQGPAVRHALVLCSEVVPDARRLSCEGEVIRIDLPEGDFRIRLETVPGGTRLHFYVTFREDGPAGGTWWSSWETEVAAAPGSAEAGAVLDTQIRESRRTFARSLADAAAGAAAVDGLPAAA
ncbi:hypothetical protein ACFQVC_34250 [Streptomyces monticola]|uniref:SRPBCC family protein n=1 Tax=Streptomyces monticola TaxID=2666263 RepID=A0ABW2JV32_9ACTN